MLLQRLAPLAVVIAFVSACAPAVPAAPTATPIAAPTSAPAIAPNPVPTSAAAAPSPAVAASPSAALTTPPSPSPVAAAKPAASPAVVASPSAAAAGAAQSTQAAAAPAPAGDAAHGQQVFMTAGCYACHGTVGQGASTGPKLAPNPIPFAAVQQQVRQPRQDMPRFGPEFVSDQDLADIYAYLQSIPAGPPATAIPLLNR